MTSFTSIAARNSLRTVILLLCFFANEFLLAGEQLSPPAFGEAIKIGEVTSDSAIVWVRLCKTEKCDDQFRLPGCLGKVRIRYRADGSNEDFTTDWQTVDPVADFSTKIILKDLSPSTSYLFDLEAKNDAGETSIAGKFRTAPAADDPARVQFTVTTGHKYDTIDDPGNGQRIYPSMLKLDPDFFVHTGDIVYYDADTPPLAKNPELARLHWHRMYNLPNHREFHRQIPSYFIKDDHDLLANDCWPGQTYGDLTFAEGQRIFLEQNPIDSPTYRTIRWGKHLQVWLVEGRDHRSPNPEPDGPDKTIWGAEQMEWFKKTVEESDATFKVLISPTPIVGPDRANKRDNHANPAFQHEGNTLRKFIADHPNLSVICGDRHWQYVSVDPATGIREYSCGPSTNAHSGGWKQSDRRPEHEYLRVRGGFLSVEVDDNSGEPQIAFRFHGVGGRVQHEVKHERNDTP